MTYNLTPLLTTIAASSASFVAILGGFIASKLISISGDRELVLTKLFENEQQRKFKEDEQTRLKRKLTMREALSFIDINIESLLKHEDVKKAYREDIRQFIPLASLTPYWDNALILLEELVDEALCKDAVFNEFNLPKQYAEKHHDDEFAYSVGIKIINGLEKQRRKDSPYGLLTEASSIVSFEDSFESQVDQNRLKELSSELKWLELQHYQLVGEKVKLSTPKGMKSGLIIFGIFSLFCIIMPMIFIPLTVESYSMFCAVKAIVLLLFATGLISVFGFLVYLLKWQSENSKK